MSAPVFISYSSKDRKVAQTICTALENRGLVCWMAGRDVGPGQSFQEAIVRAIRAAKVMVLVFTDNANNSGEIKKELALASHHNLVVIPARVEDVVPSEAFAYELATRQWIDLFENWEGEIERLTNWIAQFVPAATPSVRPEPPMNQPYPAVSSTPAPLPPLRPMPVPPPPERQPPQSVSPPPAAASATDDSGSSELPSAVRTIGWLLIAQSISRLGLWLSFTPSITIDYLTSTGPWRIIALGIIAFIAGLLILRRSSSARPFGLIASAICLLAQIYFFSNVFPAYLSGRGTGPLFTFSVWVIHPAYLLTFAAALLVLYRWRAARP
jgi:hypothetical protein